MKAFGERLEQALRGVAHRDVAAAQIEAAADQARAVLHDIEAVEAGASDVRGQIMAEVTAGDGGRSVAHAVAALAKLDVEARDRAILRELAVSIVEGLSVRADKRAAFEAARDEQRAPMLEQMKRAENLARQAREYQAHAARIVDLLRIDVRISSIGAGLLNAAARAAVPANTRAHAFDFDLRVPFVLAGANLLATLKLPGSWPPSYVDLGGGHAAFLGRPYFTFDDSVEQMKNEILRPLLELRGKNGSPSVMEAELAVSRAQTRVLAEYGQLAATIEGVLSLDETVTEVDRGLRFPDGARVFDQVIFPAGWFVGRMRSRILLPPVEGLALIAAE